MNRQAADDHAPSQSVPDAPPNAAPTPESPAPAGNPRLFAADEIPTPPPEMRRPPGEQTEKGLFDDE